MQGPFRPFSTQMAATSNMSNPAAWLVESIGGQASDTGVRVNHDTVLSSGPVYQAVTLIASDLAQLPLEVFKVSKGKGKERDDNHRIANIFNHGGNNEMLPFHMRQTLLGWMLIHGNGLAVIEWKHGDPVGLYPLQPGNCRLERVPKTTENDKAGISNLLYYIVTLNNGQEQNYLTSEIFHLKMFGNGLWGTSPIDTFKNTFGKGMAMTKFQGRSFANAARPSGVLQKNYGQGIPTKISPEARENLRREWDEMHSGLDNTGKVAILTDGLEWKAMSVTPEQNQMIESLKFYREEIAGIYNLPPHKLGAMENSAVRANIEEQNRTYVQATLMPHAKVVEQEAIRKLCRESEKLSRSCVVRHNFKEFLRADIAARYNAYAVGRNWGWLSANDVLRLEDMDEIGDQGDKYLIPSNMASAETGIPFAVGANPASPDPDSDNSDDSTEGLLNYARQTMHARQAVEIKAVRRSFNSKPDFGESLEKYYATFPKFITEALEPLTVVDGFIGSSHLQLNAERYASRSLEMLRNAVSEEELTEIIVQFPRRVEEFVTCLTEKELSNA